ncbi:MAG: S49 family peptidase, partial [candidate division Zixibacteria bacterium]|nr:S49 family peptidase [candidate division Zixibacteria bacterium]
MKKKNLIISILFLIFLTSSGFGYQSPTQSFVLPYNSVATSDDILAIKYNPAGLGLRRDFQSSFFHTYSDSGFEGDNAWLLSSGGLGFSVEWLGNVTSQSYRKYTLAGGGKFADGFYWGSSYSWFGSRYEDYDKLSSWKIGLLLRPLESLSFGAIAKDLNRSRFRGEKTDISFDCGLAIRPIGDRLTLSVDGSMSQKEKLKDAAMMYRAEFEPLDGFIISGDVDNDGNFGIGGRINLPNLGLGSYNSITKDNDFNQGITYLNLSKDRYRTLLQRRNNFLELKLSGKIVEENTRVGILGRKKPTMMDLLNDIERAKEDESIKRIILRIDPLDIGLAKAQEIREAILDFKESGKSVIAYMEFGGNREYYIATIADKIVMMPSGYLMFTGLNAEVTFIKGTLDKLGIVADLEHIGDYKSASDLVTRDKMSEAHREVVNSLLDDMYDQITKDVAFLRGWSQDEVKSKIDQGPFTASEAYEANLVDTLMYYDQIDDVIKEMEGKKPNRINHKRYARRTYYKYSWAIPPKIAVIFATGAIFEGESGRDFLWGDVMGSETIANAIKTAREDNTVKAIVFRVDSPGGSGIASDVILREIIRTKGKKPFIVSMSDVAGSGGYWISCAADTIVSLPGTYTGSIGVISGKISLEGLYEKIGFTGEVIKRGKHADFFTTTRQFTDEEREIVKG